MLFELKDKVAVITGAAGGIGSLVARYLVNENAKASKLLFLIYTENNETAKLVMLDE